MKKFFALLAIAAVAFSCSEELSVEVTSENEGINLVPVTFTATADMTKAVLDGLDVSFSAGDKIAIFKNGNKYQFTTAAGGANATFEGSIDAADIEAAGDYYALFPYSDAAGIDGGTITGVTLAKYSTATRGSFAPQQAIFVAKSSTTALTFKSAVALLKITVPDGITDLKEIAIFNRQNTSAPFTGAITGVFNVTPGEGYPSVEVTGKHGDPHTAGLNPSGSVFSSGDYYIPVLPSTLTKGFDMKLVFNDPSDSFTGRLAIGSELTFAAGKVYNLGAIRRQRFFVMDGFENETPDVKSSKWTGNDVYVRTNPYSAPEYGDNSSSKVLEMDMHTRGGSSATSGYLQYTIPISSTSFMGFFKSVSIKVYYGDTYGKDDYYPRLKWNKDGTATLPAEVNGSEIADKDSFDAAIQKNKWNTFTWNASQWAGKSNLSTLTSVEIRFFVDWSNGSLTTGAGYSLYCCIDDLTFNL
jgi:hypothetical protein